MNNEQGFSTLKDKIGIGLLGLGIVGSGVAKTLIERRELLAAKTGCPIILKKVLVRDTNKPRPVKIDSQLLTTKAEEVISNNDVDIVVEVIGGEHPALEYVKAALSAGKHVVTANKEVVAKYGAELLSLAQRHRVALRYEASVGGAIPIISPLQQDLIANNISAIYGIINGTTNYILTQMAQKGTDFSSALRQAKELGYTEADPTNDIEGFDARYKLAIMATLAFHMKVTPKDIYCEGISRLEACDFRYAKELGYRIKLLAIAKKSGESVEARVHPVFVPKDSLLAKVDGVYNAIQVEGDLAGKLFFCGEGAGSLPATSAVIADILAIARDICQGATSTSRLSVSEGGSVKSMSEVETCYYFRMTVADQPGVLAQISSILGNHQISISSVIQKKRDAVVQTAEIVIMTHPAKEQAIQEALKEITQLAVVKGIINPIRVGI